MISKGKGIHPARYRTIEERGDLTGRVEDTVLGMGM